MLEGLDWQKELNCTLTGRFCWPIFGASRLQYQAIATAFMPCYTRAAEALALLRDTAYSPAGFCIALCQDRDRTLLSFLAFWLLLTHSNIIAWLFPSLWLQAQRSGCDFVFPRFASSGAEQRGSALCHPANPNQTTECSECIVAIAWKAAAKPSCSHKLVTSCHLSWPDRPFHCSWVSISCRSQKAVVEPRQSKIWHHATSGSNKKDALNDLKRIWAVLNGSNLLIWNSTCHWSVAEWLPWVYCCFCQLPRSERQSFTSSSNVGSGRLGAELRAVKRTIERLDEYFLVYIL